MRRREWLKNLGVQSQPAFQYGLRRIAKGRELIRLVRRQRQRSRTAKRDPRPFVIRLLRQRHYQPLIQTQHGMSEERNGETANCLGILIGWDLPHLHRQYARGGVYGRAWIDKHRYGDRAR